MNRIEMLNNGLDASTNLNECLQVNQEHLFKAIFNPFCNAKLINKMLEDITVGGNSSGILSRMKITGKVLANRFSEINKLDEVSSYLSKHISDIARGWACFILPQQVPFLTLQDLLKHIQPFAKDKHFGVREWAWMAVREKLELDLTLSIELLSTWSIDPNPFIRRFAIECLRPRGVWCKHIALLKTQPEIALSLIEPVKNDPEQYVQDSIANWLNDASKTQPVWVSELCERWLSESNSQFTLRITKKALRTINKLKKGK